MDINNKHDLVIRNGKIIDGSGSKPFFGDIAIDDGKITSVGKIESSGKKEFDAKANLVTPGWVDIHTHYDGQVSWDPYLTPSSWHGVTTAVMGNCGVGFAPVRPGDENFLIQLMEGVEDIPGSALHEGIDWDWETFPEFLDAIDKKEFVMDVGFMMGHGPLRSYVMGGDGSSLRANSPLGLEGVSGGHYSQATGLRPEHNPPTLHQRILKQQFAKFMT